MAKKRKNKKTPHVGIGRFFPREIMAFAIPETIFCSACILSSVAVLLWKQSALYALLYISAACAILAPAVVSARRVMRDVADSERLFSRVAPSDRAYVRAGTVAASKCLASLIASAVSAAAVFAAARIISTWTLASAAAVTALSASCYACLAADVTSVTHTVGSSRERRGFILGFVGIYTVGLLVLMFVFACLSGIPLGDDFDGGAIPEKTVLGLSLIYLLATAVRAVYLYFMFRRRLRGKLRLK